MAWNRRFLCNLIQATKPATSSRVKGESVISENDKFEMKPKLPKVKPEPEIKYGRNEFQEC